MSTNIEIEDVVIKTYLEIYLNALNTNASKKSLNNIKSRMQELLQRRNYKK